MPLLLPTSSFKTTATFFLAGVFSVAAAVTFTVPSVSHFAVSCFPTIYDNTVFLLKPPYLYLVINCIIVSIVATSKLTHKSPTSVDDSDFSEVVTPVTVVPVPTDIDSGYLNVASDYTGFVAPVDPTVEDVRESFPDDNLTVDDGGDQKKETEMLKPISSDSSEIPKPKNDSPEKISILKQSRKPPIFGQQKSLKTNPEGGGGATEEARHAGVDVEEDNGRTFDAVNEAFDQIRHVARKDARAKLVSAKQGEDDEV
ncbi:unnamed protein product [Arabis nemorensis]|uniref:DUF4408 domain-containing protein n=1 Tax=Arabis nemorensis TaxID=586526 RepID=A0A565CQG3_9BRAS|nr:unnamed protein product [Arabis nemorensis]